MAIERHDLTVHDELCRPQIGERGGNLREIRRQVARPAGEKFCLAAVSDAERANAVQLQLEQPAVVVRQLGPEPGLHRLHEICCDW